MILNHTVSSPEANAYASEAQANTFFETLPGAEAWASLSSTQKAQLLITASRDIDTVPMLGERLFRDGGVLGKAQALKLPRYGWPTYSGQTATGSTASQLIIPALMGTDYYRDDFWAEGAAIIISGDQAQEIRRITAFDRLTGAFTVEPFDESPANESVILVGPLPSKLIQATCLQAWYLYSLGSHTDPRRELINQGVRSYRLPGISETFSGEQRPAVQGALCIAAFEVIQELGVVSRGITLKAS